ncbi:hypothetical protein BDP27DRAFT_1349035 [Rhodocollybia butyracea]|uniref:Uncharacterized protein n=1 Tax=Rhodocollybia butyracea TaxID=206335 RepID=A0A9P5P1A9_9AGAR|nr:hypothetical protein BDP27DRAFT_1349035 [Rhodocollybia butyracea]
MAKAEELPSELQDEIFSLVASDLHCVPNIALVDKRVNERLLSTFYTTVALTSDTQLEKFMRLDRPKVTTLTILSVSRISLLVDVPQKCPNLQAFSIQNTYNFSTGLEPDDDRALTHLTHLNCERLTPWGEPRLLVDVCLSSFPSLTHISFNVESNDSPADTALTVEKWLKLPGLKRLILRFCSDRDVDQFCSSISGAKQIADPRVVCLQMPSPSPLSNGDHFEFLSRVWVLGEEVHSNNSTALKKL